MVKALCSCWLALLASLSLGHDAVHVKQELTHPRKIESLFTSSRAFSKPQLKQSKSTKPIKRAQLTETFPDVPENHDIFLLLARIKRAGFLVAFADRIQRHPVWTREEVATALSEVLHLPQRAWKDYFQAEAMKASEVLDSYAEVRAVASNAEWNKGVRRTLLNAISELNADLLALNYDVAHLRQSANTIGARFDRFSDLLLQQLSAAKFSPFYDVPSDHWASDAVQELKFLGSLKGYPGGRFGGG